MSVRTKIVCTIGPQVNSFEKIIQLIDAGMNVARLNFSHGTHEEHLQVIELLKRARREKNVPLAIMLDTKGPEIRVGKMKGGLVPLQAGQELLLTHELVEGDETRITITPVGILKDTKVGTRLLFDDGYITTEVTRITDLGVHLKVYNSASLKSRAGVNIPHMIVDLPAMTEQDVHDLKFGCKHDVDLIAASFIRSAAHMLEIKDLLKREGKEDIPVLAKIENGEGVQKFDEILEVADGIMVARGDLGVELPLKCVPSLQKMMIRKCYLAHKPVITATQMLESMIKNPRPTRAEVSDVANAIYDSTSAVMLSGETAAGLYPIEAVEMMRSIIEEAEKEFDYREFFQRVQTPRRHDISFSVSLASVQTAYTAQAQAIFVFTSSGSTARYISQFRPNIPIVAVTPFEKIYHRLSLNWGVIPLKSTACKNVHEAFIQASSFALEQKILSPGALVVSTAGARFGVSGTTNLMFVETIGKEGPQL